MLPLSVAERMIGHDLQRRRLLPALTVQVSRGTASGQTLSRTTEAVRELLREALRAFASSRVIWRTDDHT